ncbi:MAG: hypothetical protein ACM3UR_10410 [Bacteroidota bacterium]|jgi:hypothetical protein|nr:hypothetical protein [Ignavibacteria bacterium]MCU7499685.1 hypothetical protein [Ignavibacteria bacterium]MCU7511987.1 hypothetical protein [Ignavibacteria bacterium]MCU7521313.1 hypothetical protein [Ignavibacteria bacterium]MCU7524762.1 hypothetical protein [Ignavibacteria bacterium]
MEIKAVLKIDLPGDPTIKQCRDFYQELSERNWQKMTNEEARFIVVYNNLLSYEEALDAIKKEISQASRISGIARYGTLVHFIENNTVVFFCGKAD